MKKTLLKNKQAHKPQVGTIGQRWQVAIVLIAGCLMGLTPAPVEAWFLAWVGLVPLWFFLVQSQKQRLNIQHAALLGLVWGCGYHGLALSWITGVHPMTWMGVPWLASLAIAIFCWVFITLWGSIYVALWAAGLFWLNQTSRLLPWVRVLIGTALWCGLEWLWSEGALYWSSISYTQSPHNLLILHLGQISGPLAVTAALVAVNGFIAEAWVNDMFPPSRGDKGGLGVPRQRYLGVAAGLFVGLHLLGFGLYSRPLVQSPEMALRVGIIQGNVPNTIKLYPEGWRRAIEGYTEGYRQLARQGVDAVLTPETALPFMLTELKQGSFYSAVVNEGVLAWLGGFGESGRSFTNSLFTITGTGEVYSQYSKVKLVPLGEYIPFEEFLGNFINRLSPLDAHLAAGEPNQRFDTPFGRAIAGICYESAFAEHFRRQAAAGGQFIITASNNAHYSESMPAQHHAQDVMRAIESDRWAARATNTGYSAIVDPHGRTLWISGVNTYEVHAGTIYRRDTQTLYVRWGDWLTPVLLGFAGVFWFLGRLKVV